MPLSATSQRILAEEARQRTPDPDIIDRHLTAKLLGVTLRTLQRWNSKGFGPQRQNHPQSRPIWYSRTEVEQWGAMHGYCSGNNQSKMQ